MRQIAAITFALVVIGCHRTLPVACADRNFQFDDHADRRMREWMVRFVQDGEEAVRRRFSRVKVGHSRNQVRKIMGRAPDWQTADRWGYVISLFVLEDMAMEKQPSLVVEFDGDAVARALERLPTPEYIAAARAAAQPSDGSDAATPSEGGGRETE